MAAEPQRARIIDTDGLLSELRPDRLGSALVAGAVNAVITITAAIAYALMIWSGSLSQFAAAGIGITLFTSAIAVFIALTSSIRNTNALPQDAPTAILALIAAAIAQDLAGAPPEQVFMTVAAAIAVCTILIGAFFICWVVCASPR